MEDVKQGRKEERKEGRAGAQAQGIYTLFYKFERV